MNPQDLIEDPTGDFVIVEDPYKKVKLYDEASHRHKVRYKNNFKQNLAKLALEYVDILIEEANK